jgi:hypothetical protein
MTADPDVEAFVTQQRAGTRRRIALAVGVLVAVSGIVVAGYVVLRPTPCERVADRICVYASGPECSGLRKAIAEAVPMDSCTEALGAIDVAEAMPRDMRAAAMTQVITGMFGIPPEVKRHLEEAGQAVSGPLAELDRTGKVTDEAKKALVSAPPAACLVYLGKMSGGPPFAQQPLHEVLVSMNGGRDLGPGPEHWREWCRQRAGLTAQRGDDAGPNL